MSDAKIVTRDAAIDDFDFIMNSWLKSQYYSSNYWSQMDKDVFYRYYASKIKKILNTSQVSIAVLSDSPGIIIGYLVHSSDVAHWVYVKKDYRSQGIANLLTNRHKIQFGTSSTPAGASIMRKKKINFNPFLQDT